MPHLISIHIPKTAGTSFYSILKQVYGPTLSPSYKRKDVKKQPNWEAHEVIHGHFSYREIAHLHRTHGAKVICWLRHPVDRVISNHTFFIAGLSQPHKNLRQYELNKHRIHEDLLTYAQKTENRNRMSKFLAGISLEELFFVGKMERFEKEVGRLGKQLGWTTVQIPKLNTLERPEVDETTRNKILALNQQDFELYTNAFNLVGPT